MLVNWAFNQRILMVLKMIRLAHVDIVVNVHKWEYCNLFACWLRMLG